MKDADFKSLSHPVGDNLIASTGTAVSEGYKPDVTVKDLIGTLRFILESEQKTDRKAFLGALLKAEMHSEQLNAAPELIIVMQTFGNTTTKQIANHIRPYMHWIAKMKKGTLSLTAIHVLSDTEYLDAINCGELLGSTAFKGRGHVLYATSSQFAAG